MARHRGTESTLARTFPNVTKLPEKLEALTSDTFAVTTDRGVRTTATGPVRRRIVD
jgi:hypothetical protein